MALIITISLIVGIIISVFTIIDYTYSKALGILATVIDLILLGLISIFINFNSSILTTIVAMFFIIIINYGDKKTNSKDKEVKVDNKKYFEKINNSYIFFKNNIKAFITYIYIENILSEVIIILILLALGLLLQNYFDLTKIKSIKEINDYSSILFQAQVATISISIVIVSLVSLVSNKKYYGIDSVEYLLYHKKTYHRFIVQIVFVLISSIILFFNLYILVFIIFTISIIYTILILKDIIPEICNQTKLENNIKSLFMNTIKRSYNKLVDIDPYNTKSQNDLDIFSNYMDNWYLYVIDSIKRNDNYNFILVSLNNIHNILYINCENININALKTLYTYSISIFSELIKNKRYDCLYNIIPLISYLYYSKNNFYHNKYNTYTFFDYNGIISFLITNISSLHYYNCNYIYTLNNSIFAYSMYIMVIIKNITDRKIIDKYIENLRLLIITYIKLINNNTNFSKEDKKVAFTFIYEFISKYENKNITETIIIYNGKRLCFFSYEQYLIDECDYNENDLDKYFQENKEIKEIISKGKENLYNAMILNLNNEQ